MATIVTDKIGRLFISPQELRRRLPRLPRMLTEAVPSAPATLRDVEVPRFFREVHVHGGYRPLGQPWHYYFLSLFRRHNETVNVWTHLLGAMLVLRRAARMAETVDLAGDPHAWPLAVLLLSSLTYLCLSSVAHLLSSRSEFCHFAFFFLDYVGVALYQYGSAAAHFYYAAEEGWHRRVGGVFMPLAAFLCCLSCLGCCYGKYRSHSLPAWVRKVGQVVPSTLAYTWDTSPVFHRVLSGDVGEALGGGGDPALPFHCGQVAFFMSAAFFFTQPLPERWLPGRCDFLGQGHQLFHALLVLCTLCQIHASHLDYLGRRPIYRRLHGDGDDARFFVALYAASALVCAAIATAMAVKVHRLLHRKDRSNVTYPNPSIPIQGGEGISEEEGERRGCRKIKRFSRHGRTQICCNGHQVVLHHRHGVQGGEVPAVGDHSLPGGEEHPVRADRHLGGRGRAGGDEEQGGEPLGGAPTAVQRGPVLRGLLHVLGGGGGEHSGAVSEAGLKNPVCLPLPLSCFYQKNQNKPRNNQSASTFLQTTPSDEMTIPHMLIHLNFAYSC